MTHVYSASRSRRSAVFTAIIALHFAIFLVLISEQVPIRVPERERIPIKVYPSKPPVPKLVQPGKPILVEIGDVKATEPELRIPNFDPTELQAGPGTAGEIPGESAAVDRVNASLRGVSSDFASVIRACYPAGARRAGEEGTVAIAVAIGADGRAGSWRLLQSSGFPRLDAAVPCVLDKLRFNAAREDGRAVLSQVRLPIVFRLK